MRRRLAKICLLSLSLFALGLSPAVADLVSVLPEIGGLQHWSVFTLGATTNRDELTGNAYVEGDVGVAGMADIALKDGATIDGNLYYRSNGTVTRGPNTTITGGTFNNQDAQLDQDAMDALASWRSAARMRQNFFAPNDITLRGAGNFTVSGAPGDSVVLNLGNFTLRGNSSFTLEGTASTTFIINVTKQFALSGNAQIVLSGGVQWNNVLFNISGNDGVVSLSRNSHLSGIILAARRTVQLSGRARVFGEVIANRVVFSNTGFNGNAIVGHPPLVSP